MNQMIQETFSVFKEIIIKSRKFSKEQMEEISKAKTFSGYKAIELNMVDQIMLSDDYIDTLLEKKYQVWICTKDKKNTSFLNSLFDNNIKMLGNEIYNLFVKFNNDQYNTSIKLI